MENNNEAPENVFVVCSFMLRRRCIRACASRPRAHALERADGAVGVVEQRQAGSRRSLRCS